MKKAVISTVFVYAISAIIIVLVFYFGYRGISSMQKANEASIMEKFQLRMPADFNKLSISYGTTARFTYDIAKSYETFCFVDLYLDPSEELIRNQTLSADYPIIWDSVESNSPNNVFALGKNIFILNVGKLRVACPPYVYCIDISKNKIDFFAQGGGDSVIILGENATPC